MTLRRSELQTVFVRSEEKQLERRQARCQHVHCISVQHLRQRSAEMISLHPDQQKERTDLISDVYVELLWAYAEVHFILERPMLDCCAFSAPQTHVYGIFFHSF